MPTSRFSYSLSSTLNCDRVLFLSTEFSISMLLKIFPWRSEGKEWTSSLERLPMNVACQSGRAPSDLNFNRSTQKCVACRDQQKKLEHAS
jgi:hypothetical protein